MCIYYIQPFPYKLQHSPSEPHSWQPTRSACPTFPETTFPPKAPQKSDLAMFRLTLSSLFLGIKLLYAFKMFSFLIFLNFLKLLCYSYYWCFVLPQWMSLPWPSPVQGTGAMAGAQVGFMLRWNASHGWASGKSLYLFSALAASK